MKRERMKHDWQHVWGGTSKGRRFAGVKKDARARARTEPVLCCLVSGLFVDWAQCRETQSRGGAARRLAASGSDIQKALPADASWVALSATASGSCEAMSPVRGRDSPYDAS